MGLAGAGTENGGDLLVYFKAVCLQEVGLDSPRLSNEERTLTVIIILRLLADICACGLAPLPQDRISLLCLYLKL